MSVSRRTIIGGAALAASLALAPMAANAQEHSWKMQSLWQAGSVNQKVFERFTENVAKVTNGRLAIEPLPVGTIVSYTETLDALSTGILESQHSGGPYFAGREPALALIGDLNGGFENPYQMQMWFEYGGGLELAREIYARFNIFFVGPVWWGVESLPSKVPLRNIADLQGIKMRSPEGLGADIWNRLGVGVVTLPGSEVYTALDRGVIDAADWGTLGMNHDLGYHDIAPYPIHPGFHSMPAADVAVNMDRWNALSDDLKAIMEMAVRDFSRDMIQTIALEDVRAEREAAEQGIEIIAWSEEERRRFREVSLQAWEEWATKSEMSRRVLDSQLAFMRQIHLLD